MGDDVNDHSYSFNLAADASLSDLFEHLAAKRYLPSVKGLNHSWEAIIENNAVARFIANSHKPAVSDSLLDKVSKHATAGVLRLHFKYNSAAT